MQKFIIVSSLLMASCAGGGVYASENECVPLNAFLEAVNKTPEIMLVNQNNKLVMVYETKTNVLIVSVDTSKETVCLDSYGKKLTMVKG